MRQIDKCRAYMKENGLDAVFVSNGYNIFYLSGFRSFDGYLFITSSKLIILTDSRYTEQARDQSPLFTVYEISKKRNYKDYLYQLLEEDKIKKLGFEDRYMTCAEYEDFQNESSDVLWIPVKNELDRLRMIKTDEEIALSKHAEAIGDLAFKHILDIIKPGMTELEVAAELEYIMKKNNAEQLSFDTIVASGIRSALPHAMPTEKKLEQSDFVTMDFGCVYKGYCSDMTRTIVIGKADEKQKEIYHAVLKAQCAALDMVKAGYKGSEVDKTARIIIEEAGYGQYFGHGLGHATGIEVHEEPRFSPLCDTIIEENMIMTVEPGIYLPSYGGVRIEDMVVITKKGCINLTHSPKELIEI